MQFSIKSAVLNAELPQNSRLHILEVCVKLLCMVEIISKQLSVCYGHFYTVLL